MRASCQPSQQFPCARKSAANAYLHYLRFVYTELTYYNQYYEPTNRDDPVFGRSVAWHCSQMLNNFMCSCTLLLLFIAAASLLTPSQASRDRLSANAASSGRQLQQLPTAADCSRAVPHCRACRFQAFGTVTKAVCTFCETGYVVKAQGRACCEWR